MIADFVKALQREIDHFGLPGEGSHARMTPYGRLRSSAYIQNQDINPRMGAVSLLLYPTNNGVNSVLIKRPEYNGVHSGQMAFPGGKVERSDASTLAAALRETQEEIGVATNTVKPVVGLTPVYIPPSNFLVHPHVVYCDARPEFVKDPYEVAEICEYPVQQLLSDDVIQVANVQSGIGNLRLNTPYFLLKGQIVWGATAVVLNEFRDILLRMQFKS
jgi:8-oxo-dGTP pyrophosphatase MutT (NUDIX family)